MSNNPTPHANAATAYGDNAQKNSSDQREMEARILLKAANMMQDLQTNWDADDLQRIDDVLKYNRQIWMVFFDTAIENKDGNRPTDLRSNIVNLANFVFKRTVEVLGAPQKDKLDILISINRDIAAGLMTRTANQGDSNNPGAAGPASGSKPPQSSGGSLSSSA